MVFAAVKCGVNKEQSEDTILIGDMLFCDECGELSTPSIGIICVADGVGGNAGGHFASTYVAEKLKNITVAATDEIKLRYLLSDINDNLIEESSLKGLPVAATTLTGIVFSGNKEYLVHVGNTRAYVLQGKYLKQLTSDHTVYNRLLEVGRIDEATQSRKNEITNCFGGGKAALFESIIISELQEYSTLLLTSDGVHDYIEIDELERLLAADNLSIQTCEDILQAAYAAGSKDDISAVIVQK